MPLSPGDKLSPYEIVAPVGAGGMGEVYRARASKLNRDVATKVLPAALANDMQYMARFEREAQLLAAMNHPNIAAVYGIEQGALLMKLVEGADLQSPAPLDEAHAIARQIAAALEAAHEKGIIHRDLKPANIKLDSRGRGQDSRFRAGEIGRRFRHKQHRRQPRREPHHVADAVARDDARGDDPGRRGLYVAGTGARHSASDSVGVAARRLKPVVKAERSVV